MSKNEKLLPPIHPGEILREDYFNTRARFWLNLQAAYDLEVAEHELAREIEGDVRPASVAPANWQSKSLVFHPRRKKSFATFSAAMHSDTELVLLTLANLPRTMRSPVFIQGRGNGRGPRKISPTQ